MKRVCVGLFAVALIGLVGCESKNTTAGGPGATRTSASTTTDSRGPVVGQAEETFTLNVPNLATSVKQGEAKQVVISIRRGKNLDEDVTLKFDNLPKGVTVDPASPVIKKSDTDAKMTVQAANDAAVGEFTVKVTGTPTKGSAATNEFKVTVDKK